MFVWCVSVTYEYYLLRTQYSYPSFHCLTKTSFFPTPSFLSPLDLKIILCVYMVCECCLWVLPVEDPLQLSIYSLVNQGVLYSYPFLSPLDLKIILCVSCVSVAYEYYLLRTLDSYQYFHCLTKISFFPTPSFLSPLDLKTILCVSCVSVAYEYYLLRTQYN